MNASKKHLTSAAAIIFVAAGFLNGWLGATALGENLALYKPAYSSSNLSPSLGPEKAVDGSPSTSWSSQFSDPQWIYVDLGPDCNVYSVRLRWGTAYGSEYKIQVSDNASDWTDEYSTSSGDGGIDDINLGVVSARYVRMYGTQRGTIWGYSLWEFEVYGTGPPDTNAPEAPTGLTAIAFSDSQIDLDWNDNNEPDLASYNVYYSSAPGGPYDLLDSNVAESAYNDTNLPAETTYYYVVTAVDAFSNESLASSEANATTQEPPLYKDPNAPIPDRVEDLLARMTLDEKVGQMTQAERGHVYDTEVATYFLGSVLSGGGSTPGDNSPEGWADMYDAFQDAALSTRLGIPIIYGVDAVHGHNNVRDATVFPHNIGLGAANDPNLMERIGTVTALEVAATGVDWTFGPCVAVVRDERWGRTYEGFSEDPSIHNNITAAYVRGFQGADANMQGEKIVACAKHYIGDGGTTGGVNAGNTECNEAFLREIHLPPYERAIEANVGTVMTSFSRWNGDDCVYHEWLITDLLKTELGFDGFVVSDWDDVGEGSTNVKNAINAGIDMAMAPNRDDWQPFISTLKSLVPSQVPMSRIDDAVRRILRIKFKAGLFEHPYTDRSLASSFGSAEHRAVAREAVRKSLVLLKNENNILPIAKSADVFVAGRNADSLIRQCGGWTIKWQGMEHENDTSGTTILEGIESICTGSVTYDANGYGAAGDVAIVVVGEDSYAEGFGDDSDLHLYTTDITTIERVRDSGIPYVIVLVSGRPMIITDELADANAFVAAWLPGTEGDGVAQVLFGDYNFTGRLSYTWPSDMSQIPINVGDVVYDPLFPFGYGLGSPADLNEDGFVDWADVKVFCDTWLKVPGDAGYDPRANLYDDPLGIINFYDFAIFANSYR